jgi:hypothetical protein
MMRNTVLFRCRIVIYSDEPIDIQALAWVNITTISGQRRTEYERSREVAAPLYRMRAALGRVLGA